MTDADVDGAHIATCDDLLLPGNARAGKAATLAQPPLYRLANGGTIAYAATTPTRPSWKPASSSKKVEVSLQGPGRDNLMKLSETTMDPKTRGLIRITLPQDYEERRRCAIWSTG